jgi:cyclic pyranopterin phosphate synthase
MQPATSNLIETGQIKKGNVLAIARVAGIMAAKLTPMIIPLCHPIQIDAAEVDFEKTRFDESAAEWMVRARVHTHGRTGVEMEALTAVSAAALTVYDMCKGVDRSMQISQVQLDEKSGGESGLYRRSEQTALGRG